MQSVKTVSYGAVFKIWKSSDTSSNDDFCRCLSISPNPNSPIPVSPYPIILIAFNKVYDQYLYRGVHPPNNHVAIFSPLVCFPPHLTGVWGYKSRKMELKMLVRKFYSIFDIKINTFTTFLTVNCNFRILSICVYCIMKRWSLYSCFKCVWMSYWTLKVSKMCVITWQKYPFPLGCESSLLENSHSDNKTINVWNVNILSLDQSP